MAVAVEVRCGNSHRALFPLAKCNRRSARGNKRSASVVQENGDGAVASIGDGQIRARIAVEVAGNDRVRTLAGGEIAARKCSGGKDGGKLRRAEACRKQRQGDGETLADKK